MAKGKTMARPDIASYSKFDALSIDVGDEDFEDETPQTESSTPSAPSTPSKKALARQRAKLRKASASNLASTSAPSTPDGNPDSNGADDYTKSALGKADRFLESATAKAKESVPHSKTVTNGAKDAATAATSAVAQAVGETKPVLSAGLSTARTAYADIAKKASATLPSAPLPNLMMTDSHTSKPIPIPEKAIAESATSSDAETQLDYNEDDDDVSDVEEPAPIAAEEGSTTPKKAPSPSERALKEQYTGADHDPGKKKKAIITRTVWGLFMVASLISLVCMGHVYVICLVFVSQAVVFSELTSLFDAGYSSGHGRRESMSNSESSLSPRSIQTRKDVERELRRKGRKEERDRWSRRMSWYFFAATNYFLYGESLIYYFKHILTLQASFLPSTFSFAQHHRLISFSLYVIGFVSFVANLERATLRRQFGLFGWIHMSLLLIVVSSHFIVNNILEGLIWFWVPASLVIMNDIAAYACGMAFGRHQLIKLSPKKTVEGFVGAFFVTIAFGVLWGTLFMRFNYMVCPVQDLATNVLSNMQCSPNKTFVWRELSLPSSIALWISKLTHKSITSIPWAPFQLHVVVLAVFASLVAPFGGFFASGFKRAFNIKDFGASIPGHGGLTDRMDCQFLMGLFTYVYFAALIRETHVTVSGLLGTIVSALTTEQQIELLGELSKVLAQKGIQAAKHPFSS